MKISIGAIDQIEQLSTFYTLGGQTGATVKDAAQAAADTAGNQDQLNSVISAAQLVAGVSTSLGKSLPDGVGSLIAWGSLTNNIAQIKTQIENGDAVSASYVHQAMSDIASILASEALLTAAVVGSPAIAAVGAGLILAGGALTIIAMADGNSTTSPEMQALISDVYQATQDFRMALGGVIDGALTGTDQFLTNLLNTAGNSFLNFFLPENLRPIDIGTSTFFTASTRYTQPRRDPLTFDLDGDGLETVGTAAGILFDHDADGIKTGTGWVKADDALLVRDVNGNGTIDNGRELFGDATLKSNGQLAADGFDALADLDSNADGQISAADSAFSSLRLWRDLNQDGISQSGELFTLDDLGIASINVASTEHSKLLSNGNQVADLGTYTKTDGTTGSTGEVSGDLGDINLATDTFHRSFTDTLQQ